MSKNKELVTSADAEALKALNDSYPVENSYKQILLPRISFVSQDVTEEVKNKKTGKKEINIITEAGIFILEKQTEELDENDKKIWEKEEVGTSIKGIILYERKQLKFYDGEKYTSSPIFDSENEILPLFKDKVEVDRGTPAELKSRKEYQGKTAKGKDTSKLEENRILYVLMGEEVFQLSLRGTSMYAFLDYKKKVTPPTVVTEFDSEAKENGAISWNQITYRSLRPVTGEEASIAIEKINEIKEGIAQVKAFYSSKEETPEEKEDRLRLEEAKKAF